MATAQEDITGSDMLQAFLTNVASYGEEDQDIEQLLEQLEDLLENPVHVNQASFEDLSRITWLTEFQIKSLLEHVHKQGPILSHYEIAYLYGFTPELAQTLVPFISLDKPPDPKVDPKRMLRYGKSRLMTGIQTVLQDQEGYIRPDSAGTRYLGNSLKAYVRYSFTYSNRLYLGITAEKDAGEAFFRHNNPYGFDFYSVSFRFSTGKFLKTLAIGDFRADFAQGLALWSGLNYGKSSILLNPMRYNAGIKHYGSTDENRFMRGAGATFRIKQLDWSIFYSRKAIDATVSLRDDKDEIVEVSSFPATGYHRTPNETAQKNKVTEQVAGTNISMTRNNWHVGATAVYYDYGAALIPNKYTYNYFAFSGKSNMNYSFDFRMRLGEIIFYGEQSFDRNGAAGMLYGAQMLISEHITANILYRYYAKDFHALYGRALGESSRNNNEEGFFLGINWAPGGKWRVSAYGDIFRFPWLRYRTDAPSFGKDFFIQTDYSPARNTKLYVQAKYKERGENVNDEAVSVVRQVYTKSVKLVFSHQVIEGCGIGNHLEIKNYGKNGNESNGYFIAQDVYATFRTFKEWPLRVTLRYAVFDTDSYDSRIYSFENDMLYAFSIPSFYLQGSRFYFLLKYSPGKHFDFRFKFSSTHYPDRLTIGSGLNEIKGNRTSEIKLQMVCKF